MVGEGTEGMSAEWREDLASEQKSLKRSVLRPKAGILGKSRRDKGYSIAFPLLMGQKDQGFVPIYTASNLPHFTLWSRLFSSLSGVLSLDFPSKAGSEEHMSLDST